MSITILSLPNELIHDIFIRLDNPHTYLALYSVCHRFYDIASHPIARQSFTKYWFFVYSHSPVPLEASFLEFCARYIRRYCNDKTCPRIRCCKERKLCDTLVEPEHDAAAPSQAPTSVWDRHCALVEFQEQEGYEGRDISWVKRVTDRIAASSPAPELVPGLKWTMEDVILDIEDAVIAFFWYRTMHAEETRVVWRGSLRQQVEYEEPNTYYQLGGISDIFDAALAPEFFLVRTASASRSCKKMELAFTRNASGLCDLD
ncbi:hypothetical protein BJ508DRAFT_326982 [Ascobolus immersus RN42]|uniref:F-box domain-containing protein n=1 Tax=Ascobolus immersus RN42 TaxID=1160509 RepID=A0A3N4I9M3_ASCIM|nr:hypothetical protein BJ508DRAFT_326982 [Ascobolus immersus RN42]